MTTNVGNNKTSLLTHLANRFTNLTETLATEALGYILAQSAPARGALQEMLMGGGADVGPIARVETEFKIKVKKEGAKDKDARIDLVGFGEGDAKRTLIEVKFWAGLTENQPNAYLEELLKNDDPSALLFVAPESRLDMLWPEILRLAAKDKMERFTLGAETVANGTGLRSAVVNGAHRMALISWRAMLDEMSRKAEDLTVVKDIEQLQTLCDQQDRAAFLPLHAGEIGPGFSKRATDLHNLYNDVIGRIHKEGIADGKGLAVGRSGANYGRYTRLGRYVKTEDGVVSIAWFDVAWVGIHFEFGTQYRETPFWVMLGYGGGHPKIELMREILDAARRESGLDVIHTEYGKMPVSLVPIYLPTGVEYNAVLYDVVSQIRNIGDILAAGMEDAIAGGRE